LQQQSLSYSEKLKKFFYLPKNAWILTSTSSVWSIGGAMANPYQTLYFAALGVSPLFIGLLVGYGTAVTIVALLVGGYVADTWGRKKVIIIFSWVSVASAFVYFFINSPYLVPIPLTLASVASVYTPAFNSVMMDSIEPEDRIRGFSVFNAINTIPSVIAPTLGGLLMGDFGILNGLKIAYLGSGLFGVVAILIRSIKLKETFVTKPLVRMSLFSYVRESLRSGIDATKKSDSVVKKLLLYVTLAGIGTGLTSPYASIYVVNYLGINPFSYSIVVDLAGLTTVSLLLGVVFLIQRLGAKRSTLVASVAAPVSNIMFSQAKTMDELLEWGVTGAVATALQTPSLATMEAETIPQPSRGRILAMFSILPALVSLPSQVGAGYLYSGTSPTSPFIVSIVPFGVGALVLYSTGKGTKQQD
jgi:DHA1 family tetracycline resistance protein-like MFS transporter